MRGGFLLVLFATTLFTTLFMVAYFALMHHPRHEPFVVPMTAIDHMVPFQAPMMLVYLTLWVYIGFGPGTLRVRRDMFHYAAWMIAMCIVGLLCFWIFPTRAPVAAPANASGYGFDLLRGIDAASNACPSMHVAAAFFTGVRLHETLKRIAAPWWPKAINIAWCATIIWSTMAVRQHVFIDVVAGLLLALLFVIPSMRHRPV